MPDFAKLYRKITSIFDSSHDNKELVIYASIWLIVISICPLVELYNVQTGFSSSYRWDSVAQGLVWVIPYLAGFLINDLILSHLIIRRQKILLYVLAAFAVAIVIQLIADERRESMRQHEIEKIEASHHDETPPAEPMREPMPAPDDEPMHMRPDDMKPQHDHEAPPPKPREDRIGPKDDFEPRRRNHIGPLIGRIAITLLLMTLGTTVKLYLLGERDKQRLEKLDHERTKAELSQLRYQLSPHFMMTTLNNIHALIDIDTERAKETIVQMSKLMRYVLYESDKTLAPLSAEVDFLQNYINLMRIRYTDKVKISFSSPTSTDGIMIPPLLTVNMVENAFKHGVSYSHDSFVNVSLSVPDDHSRVDFLCINSLAQKPQDGQHGIGLANVRKRLELLCPGNYVFSTGEKNGTYEARLSISLPLA